MKTEVCKVNSEFTKSCRYGARYPPGMGMDCWELNHQFDRERRNRAALRKRTAILFLEVEAFEDLNSLI